MKVPACYENPNSPSCIDLILTNKPRKFQNSCESETSLSDFHKMTDTSLKMQFRRLKPRVLFYIDYTKFSNETFINSLKARLNIKSISPDENRFLNFSNNHAPRKLKTIRGNQISFINKEILKAIIKRTELRNKFLKHKTHESRQAFVKKRNYCVS